MKRIYKITKRKNRVTKHSKMDQLRMLVIPKGRIAHKLKDVVLGIRKTLLRPR